MSELKTEIPVFCLQEIPTYRLQPSGRKQEEYSSCAFIQKVKTKSLNYFRKRISISSFHFLNKNTGRIFCLTVEAGISCTPETEFWFLYKILVSLNPYFQVTMCAARKTQYHINETLTFQLSMIPFN